MKTLLMIFGTMFAANTYSGWLTLFGLTVVGLVLTIEFMHPEPDVPKARISCLEDGTVRLQYGNLYVTKETISEMVNYCKDNGIKAEF